MYDELELDLVRETGKTAQFFIISDTDATFQLPGRSMAYTQLFNCFEKERMISMKSWLAGASALPGLTRRLILGRSRTSKNSWQRSGPERFRAWPGLQAQSQLKALYKDNMDTIIGNCDSSLFPEERKKPPQKAGAPSWGKKPLICITPAPRRARRNPTGQNFQKLAKI